MSANREVLACGQWTSLGQESGHNRDPDLRFSTRSNSGIAAGQGFALVAVLLELFVLSSLCHRSKPLRQNAISNSITLTIVLTLDFSSRKVLLTHRAVLAVGEQAALKGVFQP
jgi:hypothetical protein